jgi:hypothetical protein
MTVVGSGHAGDVLTWLVRDRERFGFTPAQAAGRLGVIRQEYLELEAGTRWPSSTVWGADGHAV